MGEVAAMKGTVPKAGFDRQRDSLDFLIEPVERATFLETFYERLPLIAARNDPHRYADLLTLEKLDHFIASADLKEGMVELTRHKDPIPTDAYVDERGRVSGVSVVEHYLKGATIILPRLHDSMFELGEFCRSLEEIFSCHVQTNIYLTPSANQGFATHYDNHDVFVMQISGAKKWRLYDTPVAIPYRGEGFEPGQHEAGEVSAEFVLSPGECVYVPRGLMHDAQNEGDEPSLHITVGLITKTWADLLLESISELALEDPDFRRSLPPGFASRDFDRAPARRHFERLKSAIAAKAGMDGAFDLLADNFLRARRPNIAGVIASSAPVSPDDRFRRRRFVPWNVADDEGKLVLVGPGGDLEFLAQDGDAIEMALSGRPFTVRDLPGKDPVDLARILWGGGFLERIGD